MRVLVTGASGRLGSAIVASLPHEVVAPTRDELDLQDTKRIPEALERMRPDAVINAAAYTDVDGAETNQEIAMRINGDAPHAIAAWSASNNVPIIQISTDFVFSGDGVLPWIEGSETEPVNYYGVTKLRGERGVRESGAEHLIVRTSWLYGRHGKNFLRSILTAATQGGAVRVVSNQIGSPTFVEDLAKGITEIISQRERAGAMPSGALHLTNHGWVSRAEFASAAIAEAVRIGLVSSPVRVVGVTTSSYATAAKRPLNSRLDCTKATLEFGINLPSWDDALRRTLQGFSL
jgi:dTDP-4-dehydrorhamnose reductase